ncbi:MULTISPECIES: DUF1972 domain-containing protein [Vibrio]|uniref:DUF1972 domain-containing protein n=1 Tax=Vibrio TaxID=662 RepID=UPI00215CA30C|nr:MULTISPECIES: DUF1972 domain-containing protein [Vibrio]MCR9533328.1 DUF1972 domain-containing protein [Vibrio alginolyticus]MDW2067526.1 DUF1972 domain-containing protein [Vibrio sp. 1579]
MTKVAVVGTVGIPACYGGFESLVENLTKNASAGIEYKVFCSSKAYSKKLTHYNGAELLYFPLNANGAQSIPYDVLSLLRCLIMKPDVVLILGVSGCIFLPIFKLLSNCRVVTNIDGLEWKRDKWGKWTKHFLKWSENLAVRYSDVVITDNHAITEYVEKEYSVSSKTIAYGGDHAVRDIEIEQKSNDYALALCRIEPENNVEMILEAFSQVHTKLKFIGNWDSSEFGRKLKAKYYNHDNIEIMDPIYDLNLLFGLRKNCSFYIHGHSAGGTNPSLVEMMHIGVPIFCFDCDFNRYSTQNKAKYFYDSKDLKYVIEATSINEYQELSVKMKEIAENKYTWSKICSDYEQTYVG